ncbi:uncharacterized protein LOC133331408 [Musca vetustissima]|uniref:uncharacterized protein LOC133331408 n=1 Tax=Musca vetustissima TaxID=27455 RepID=UPI002AB5E060|nr:uncharacterized protein LOC133331408 [Musca vetustissima]
MASTLNILCGICSEFYTARDNIYVTRCGHVFHQQCLFHWLRVSTTCPQCRDPCLRHRCRKIYLNFQPLNESVTMEPPPPPVQNNVFSGYDWLTIDRDMDEEIVKSFGLHYGTDEDGNDIYAARGYYNNDLIPAYYCPRKNGVYAAWGFKSQFLTSNIEILDISCDNDAEYKWVAASEGELPENALVAGHTSYSEPLYIARAVHEGKTLYGKLHRQYKMAYMPFGDAEVFNTQYEVLVRIPKTTDNTQ